MGDVCVMILYFYTYSECSDNPKILTKRKKKIGKTSDIMKELFCNICNRFNRPHTLVPHPAY
jgi:hypothetical protein